jgi:hypothetical protein
MHRECIENVQRIYRECIETVQRMYRDGPLCALGAYSPLETVQESINRQPVLLIAYSLLVETVQESINTSPGLDTFNSCVAKWMISGTVLGTGAGRWDSTDIYM